MLHTLVIACPHYMYVLSYFYMYYVIHRALKFLFETTRDFFALWSLFADASLIYIYTSVLLMTKRNHRWCIYFHPPKTQCRIPTVTIVVVILTLRLAAATIQPHM